MSTSSDQACSFLLQRLRLLLQEQRDSNQKRRVIIALAGTPGSGKSSISSRLLGTLQEHAVDGVAVLPMDGFHHTKATLSKFDSPELAFRRRGAPFTFDATGLVEHIMALKKMSLTEPGEPRTELHMPSFDHAEGDPVADAIAISSECKAVIVEGNYLLLDEEPWKQIAEVADEKWFVDVPIEVAKQRLVERHLTAGIERSKSAALQRVEDNDLPNGELIREKMIEPDVRIPG